MSREDSFFFLVVFFCILSYYLNCIFLLLFCSFPKNEYFHTRSVATNYIASHTYFVRMTCMVCTRDAEAGKREKITLLSRRQLLGYHHQREHILIDVVPLIRLSMEECAIGRISNGSMHGMCV